MARFSFENLDNVTRELMLSEVQFDVEREMLYTSDRLNGFGRANYQDFLIKSVTEGDEVMLEELLDISRCFNSTELRQGRSAKVPSNASKLLSQSEFNRFYIRAVCARAIKEGVENVEVYRARESSWTRPESEAKIGLAIPAKELLEDLRNSIGAEPNLLPDINSGLSVRI